MNVTDGRYVYMRGAAAPGSGALYEYTLMPTHMRNRFDPSELQETRIAPPFSFTKGCPVMQIAAPASGMREHHFQTMLFDLQTDPLQLDPLQNPAVEALMIEHLLRLMQQNDAPAEQYARLGLG